MISFLFKKKGSMQSSLLLPCLLSGCSCCGVPIGRIIAFPGHVIHTIFHAVYNIFSCLSDTIYHVVYNCATLCGCSACCVIVVCGFIAVCSIFGIQYIVVRIGCCRTVCCRTIVPVPFPLFSVFVLVPLFVVPLLLSFTPFPHAVRPPNAIVSTKPASITLIFFIVIFSFTF